VLDMLEKSWGGLMEHTEQGYNIGKPPYGYQVITEPHPVPAKATLGKAKRRLVRDPVRGPVVTKIYTWRVVEHLSYDQIAERLNLDRTGTRHRSPSSAKAGGPSAPGPKGLCVTCCATPSTPGTWSTTGAKTPAKTAACPGRSTRRPSGSGPASPPTSR